MEIRELTEILGNLGEFVGAIAVVLTLGYLAVQVRQNTKFLRSNIYSSWVQLASMTHIMVADNAELFARVFQENESAENLGPPERLAFHALFNHTMNMFESIYLDYLEGAIDKSVFDAKHRNMVYFFRRHSLRRNLWNTSAIGIFDCRFIDYVNTRVLPDVDSSDLAPFV